MKKQIITLALCSIFSLGAAFAIPQQDQTAQPGATAEHHRGHWNMDPQKRVDFLTKKLNLTSDQQSQILNILTDQQKQMQSVHADTSLARQDRVDKMRSIREDGRTKIEAVLNADQKQKLEEMQQQARERHEQHENNTQK